MKQEMVPLGAHGFNWGCLVRLPLPFERVTIPANAEIRSRDVIGNLVRVSAVAAAAVQTIAVVAYVYGHSHFIGDDIVGFYFARTHELWGYLMNPMDVHWVPLHRAVSYVVNRCAPMNYAIGLGVLVAMHAACIVALYATLQEVRPWRWNVLLVAYYALYVHFGLLLMWWTAALHRLPYIFCAIASGYSYLRFRRERSRRWFAAMIAGVAIGLGFYMKAALIPLYLAGIEMCFWSETPARERRRHFAALLSLCVVPAIYFLVWARVVPAFVRGLRFMPSFQLQFYEIGARVFLRGLLGYAEEGRWIVDIASIGAILVLVTYSIAKARRNLVVWLVLAFFIGVNVLLTSLSKVRQELFGPFFATSQRYYFELLFVVVISTAIALRNLASRAERLDPRAHNVRTAIAVLVSAGAPLLAWNSYDQARGAITLDYGPFERTRRFIRHVDAGVRELQLRQPGPLLFEEGWLPRYVGLGLVYRHSVLLRAMAVPARFEQKARGAYRITAEGYVVPAR